MLCSSQTHMLLCLDLLLRFHCRDSLILAERRAFAPVFDSPPWDPPSAFCSGCGRLPLLSSFCTFSWIWQWIREMYPVSLFLWCRWLGSPGGFFLSWWWVVISSFFPPPSSWTQTFFRANTFPKKRHQNLSAGEQNDLLLLFQLKSKPPPTVPETDLSAPHDRNVEMVFFCCGDSPRWWAWEQKWVKSEACGASSHVQAWRRSTSGSV